MKTMIVTDTGELICKKHPRYGAVRKPRTMCVPCMLKWGEEQAEQIDEETLKAIDAVLVSLEGK